MEKGSLDLAIVHDYLIQMGGAERVVALMAETYPNAPIYTSLTAKETLLPSFRERKIHNSWLQKFPWSQRFFKQLFPLYPSAFARLKIQSGPKVLWISSSTFSKCVRKPVGAISICYCHAPTRFLWDGGDYLRTEIRNPIARGIVRLLGPLYRRIDYRAAQHIDFFVANSDNIKGRIRECYDRDAEVIHPPVDVNRFVVSHDHEGYYLIVSRLIGYKGIDRPVRAFVGLDRELRIIGDGTDRQRLESIAPPNVKFLGRVSDEEVKRQMGGMRALIFPGYEDFGITPVEAQACGKPVLAFGKGGALETIVHEKTGIHFKEGTPESLIEGLNLLEEIEWNSDEIRKHAEKFSEERFLDHMMQFMESKAL